jgi:hypothetical protein
VTAKNLQQVAIHIFQSVTFALQKTTEMGCGAQVANRSCMSVALFFKRAREAINMGSTETYSHTSDCSRTRKILLNHGVLLELQ